MTFVFNLPLTQVIVTFFALVFTEEGVGVADAMGAVNSALTIIFGLEK